MAKSKQRVSRRQYTDEFQFEAVRLADSVGLNVAADRLGVPRATVGNWARRRRKVGYPPDRTAMVTAPGPVVPKRPVGEVEAVTLP